MRLVKKSSDCSPQILGGGPQKLDNVLSSETDPEQEDLR